MSLKKIGIAQLAVFVIAAIMANSAYAENNWNATTGSWYTGASPETTLPLGGTIDLTVSGGASFLTSTIFGKPIKFTSTGVTGTECSAVNNTTTSATIDCKALVFTGVTVSGEAAAGCSTPTTITTKELTGVLGMDTGGTRTTIKITPKAGATAAFATVELTGTCANAGLHKVTGTVFAESTNATGVFAKTQKLSFSEAIQKDAGTATSLNFDTSGAFIYGSLSATAAVEWAGKEKGTFGETENNWNATTGSWYTRSGEVESKLAVGTGTIDLTVSGGASSLTSTIGAKPINFSSTGVTGTECSATNPTSSSTTIDCKALVFSGVTVSGEAATGCSTPATITTKELTGVLGMNKAGTVATIKITPKAGATAAFATVELTGTCANAGLYKVVGTVFAQAANATGVFAKTQKLSFSEAIQGDAGTPTSLKFGENGAFINGSLSATAAVEWAGKEKGTFGETENNWNATTGSWYTRSGEVESRLAVGTGTIDLTVSGGASSLTSTIGAKPINFSSTGVTGTECSATNPTSSSTTIDCKALVFSGVTVSGEAATGCSTPATITTKELTGVLGMNKAGTVATIKITPKAGATAAFATVELTGTCANAGLYKVVGTVFAQAANATGVFAKTQKLSFSEAIQGDAGTPTSLKFGENGAFINGSLSATAAVEWAGKEK